MKNINWDVAKNLIGGETYSKCRFPLTRHLKKGDVVVAIDPNYYRPTEVDLLIGDPTKAKKLLGWKAKTKFDDLIRLMVKTDFEKVIMRGYKNV